MQRDGITFIEDRDEFRNKKTHYNAMKLNRKMAADVGLNAGSAS
jgi:hypothetical protein